MKKIFKILLIALLLTGGITTVEKVTAQSVSVSLSVFQKSLNPYGRWVNHGSYGQVWVANDRNFVPYSTGGHWAYTDYGWTWVSDYNWGWAPFHYGRWAYEGGTGWYWVPGYEWAPAWVAWRSDADYYGWAPLSPGLNISVGVSWGNQIPYDRWVFAPHQYINNPNIGRYYVPRSQNVTIIRRTTVVNNVTVRNNVHFVAGPRREDVERVNHTKVQTYAVANSSRPGKTVVNKNTINVYRPVINNNSNNKTVVNNNNTTVNKNSNNTILNKNSKNTTINKNNHNTTVKNTSVNKTAVKKQVANNQNVKNAIAQKQQHINNQRNLAQQQEQAKAKNAALQNKQLQQAQQARQAQQSQAAKAAANANRAQVTRQARNVRQQQHQRQQRAQPKPQNQGNKKPNQQK